LREWDGIVPLRPDEADGEQVDLLVRELMTTRPVRRPSPPVAAQPATAAPMANVEPERPQQPGRRPGLRWSNVRILMPPPRPADRESRVALLSAWRLPQLPSLGRFARAPGPAMQVRLWVGLSVVYCAALSFWPYPKTYLWGMVLYLLSLGLMTVSGVWGARLSWDARLGSAHTLSIGTVMWALTLVVAETLPPG
jgi:hypothetical protein